MPNPTPIDGAPSEAESQGTLLATLQSAATTNGNGTTANTDGYNGAQMLEVNPSAGTGGCSLSVEGSFDQLTWYALGYQQVDALSAPARAAAALTVGSGAGSNHVYQLLDAYPFLRARISAAAAGLSLTVRLYAIPI